ncbi:MAG: hypothetical protein AAF558_08210 [Verrucomicrobiota bacterium]
MVSPTNAIPDGTYDIGVRHDYVHDASRSSIKSRPGRTIPISIFYPGSKTANAQQLRYLDVFHPAEDAVLEHLLDSLDYDPSVKEALRNEARNRVTQSFVDIPIANSKSPFPILLYSPGGEQHRFSNIPLFESIVARGYIIVTMDHPFEGVPTVDSDGVLCSQIADNDDFIEFTNQRVSDARIVLDYITQLFKQPTYRERVNLEALGMFGHSRGGYVSTFTQIEDSRIKAVANIDGFLYAYWTNDGTTGINRWPAKTQEQLRASRVPFLRIKGSIGDLAVDEVFRNEAKDFSGDFHLVVLKDWSHNQFSTSSCFLKLSTQGEEASFFLIQNQKRVRELSSHLLTFFDRYLRNEPSLIEKENRGTAHQRFRSALP